MKIAIAGTITIDADRRQACLTASAPLQAATRTDEPGCLAYVFTGDLIDPTTIAVYELWSDPQSLLAHFEHPNYVAMRAMFAEHGIAGAHVMKYRIDAEAMVYNAQRVASVSFDD